MLKPPFWLADGSLGHPLGTDHLGRDVYSRLVYGAQISLTISVLAALLGAAVGVAAGLVAGYRGGRVDTVIMRIVDLNLTQVHQTLQRYVRQSGHSGIINLPFIFAAAWRGPGW